MIDAIGQIKHGDHKGSWTFIASWDCESPSEFAGADIALLDAACEEYEAVKLWQGEESYQWWPTDALVRRTGDVGAA